jgi:uncharacterized protein (TIGR04551 family)
MALLRSFFYSLMFLLSLSINAVVNNQTVDEKSPPIPELPSEETDSTKLPDKVDDEPRTSVVNYNESQYGTGFFSDNKFSRGTSRYFNAVDLSGYFRTRFAYFRDPHLRTYIPALGYGTSMMPPNLDFMNRRYVAVADEDDKKTDVNPAQNSFSANMRLRINPTINVSEVVRIHTTVDMFDNLVLGSTPNYLAHRAPNPSWPTSFLNLSQNAPTSGINSFQGAISLKRAWAEADFPIGGIRFGRMPFHFGLGILYNSGQDINNDYGDQIDGIFFTTRIFDHFISPGYHIAYTGPQVRGGGFSADDFQSFYLPAEAGQRYPLETGDLTHVLSLSILKKDSDFLLAKKKEEGRPIFNYGLLTSYRHQSLDTQAYATGDLNLETAGKNLVKRESHVGLGSIWSAFSYDTFHIELEAAGIWGKYAVGNKDTDLLAGKDTKGNNVGNRKIWLLQGGVALESKYGFLNDRLQIGLDTGWASSQSGSGFGLREGIKQNPTPGDVDGRKLPSATAYKTNFRFNPAYSVDLLLYKEVLGGISGTLYLKPHLAYFFSRNFGLRGDFLAGIAPDKSNTPGNSNWLGVEFDASAFMRTENGFYFQLAYGLLVPFKGLNHQASVVGQHFAKFGEAQLAQTLQAFLGVVF